MPRPCFAALKGKPRLGSCRAAREQTSFAPNTETFSAVHNISVVCRSRLARSPGGLGGRSRIEFIVSPLPRRRHNESHFAAQSPERAFLAKPFFARAKNGVNSGRRSRKISVAKQNPTVSLPLRGEAKSGAILRGQRGEKEGKNRGRQNEKSMLYCYRTR